MRSILVCRTRLSPTGLAIFALILIGGSTWARAGEPVQLHKPATVHVLRDNNGDALRFGERQTVLMSTNWSGYVLPKFETKQKYTSATATWLVPSVSFQDAPPGATFEFSSSWVGIGGYCKNAKCRRTDQKLIQLGTEQDAFNDGTTNYYAWYEMLPAASIQTPLAVSPGDTITASLTCAGKCVGKQSWTLSMVNNTTGGSWSQVFTYKASKLSTEWIEEAPSLDTIQPLADFNTAVFSQSTVNSAAANLSTGDSLQLLNPAFGPTSNPSAPNSTLDGFEACWGANGMFTSCVDPFS